MKSSEEIWNYCDSKIKLISNLEAELLKDGDLGAVYCKGLITAYKQVQYEIKKKCTQLIDIEEA